MPGIDREFIALRVAREIADLGARVVNLGIGIPTLVSNFIPSVADVVLHAENGLIGYGPLAEPGEEDPDIRNAGGQLVTLLPGAASFDSAESFALIRGGHVDVAVLGGLQVAQNGDLANWMRSDRGIGSIGGAMDLVTGAKRVIVAMEHAARDGSPKLVERCTYPLTGAACVATVVTDMAVVDIRDGNFVLRERAPGVSIEQIRAATAAALRTEGETPEMAF